MLKGDSMANIYESMTKSELEGVIESLEKEYLDFKSQNLHLDMARGKPSADQVNVNKEMLDIINSNISLDIDDQDAANYGVPFGLDCARRLGADLLDVDASNVICSGSSSLNLMFDCVARGFIKGYNSNPQMLDPNRKWICLVPGYDRHFSVTKYFRYENIAVEFKDGDVDMDRIEELVENDSSIYGIWCVPKYSNPTGITFSDETVKRLANLKPAASDFKIYWDNAYCVHDLYDEGDSLLNIFDELHALGKTDLVIEFASTSKITIPGSGIAFVVADDNDLACIKEQFSVERVCPDKLNQLAHVLYLTDKRGVEDIMDKHAEFLRPRFELVLEKLNDNLASTGCCTWTHPRGGYFISFEGMNGSAKAIVNMASEIGVKLTPAGSTWPDMEDPNDSNIRIAPSYPTLTELNCALDVFVLCVKLVSARLAYMNNKCM